MKNIKYTYSHTNTKDTYDQKIAYKKKYIDMIMIYNTYDTHKHTHIYFCLPHTHIYLCIPHTHITI